MYGLDTLIIDCFRYIKIKAHFNFDDAIALAKELKPLIKKFKSYSKDNDVVLFSDHGMTPVKKGVKFELEKRFGMVSKDTYIYFVDAT